MIIEEILRNFKFIIDLRNVGQSNSIVLLEDYIDSVDSSLYTTIYLDITSAIENTRFTRDEYAVLRFTIDGYNYSEISELTGLNRMRVADLFVRVCTKLQNSLSSGYTTNLNKESETNDE